MCRRIGGPYTDGSWAYTDAGWTWISEEPFGAITYHYGRWTRLQDTGWVWVPDTEWAPAWVSWRRSEQYVGWAPLPPEATFKRDVGISSWSDSYYDVGPSQYTFVAGRDFGAPRLSTVILPRRQNVTIISETRNITDITYTSGGIYNGGPRYSVISRESREPVRRLRLERRDDVVFEGNRVRGEGMKAMIAGDALRVFAPAVSFRTEVGAAAGQPPRGASRGRPRLARCPAGEGTARAHPAGHPARTGESAEAAGFHPRDGGARLDRQCLAQRQPRCRGQAAHGARRPLDCDDRSARGHGDGESQARRASAHLGGGRLPPNGRKPATGELKPGQGRPQPATTEPAPGAPRAAREGSEPGAPRSSKPGDDQAPGREGEADRPPHPVAGKPQAVDDGASRGLHRTGPARASQDAPRERDGVKEPNSPRRPASCAPQRRELPDTGPRRARPNRTPGVKPSTTTRPEGAPEGREGKPEAPRGPKEPKVSAPGGEPPRPRTEGGAPEAPRRPEGIPPREGAAPAHRPGAPAATPAAEVKGRKGDKDKEKEKEKDKDKDKDKEKGQ